ncbi:WhiB family transcriptional regulator [Streptomyces collinus]|uniref:WhiB family transcriptional regulator n=1 Tax=Streptomyces collinus TaxID=42684 RepID=UPI003673EB02
MKTIGNIARLPLWQQRELFLDWVDRAECASIRVDPAIFYPPNRKGAPGFDRINAAKKICHMCTVSEQCLAVALKQDEQYGIWGGLTASERRRLP